MSRNCRYSLRFPLLSGLCFFRFGDYILSGRVWELSYSLEFVNDSGSTIMLDLISYIIARRELLFCVSERIKFLDSNRKNTRLNYSILILYTISFIHTLVLVRILNLLPIFKPTIEFIFSCFIWFFIFFTRASQMIKFILMKFLIAVYSSKVSIAIYTSSLDWILFVAMYL